MSEEDAPHDPPPNHDPEPEIPVADTPTTDTHPAEHHAANTQATDSDALPDPLADTQAQSVPRGWYPDPRDTTNQRYFDGEQWTEHVEPRRDLPPPKADILAPLRRVLPLAAIIFIVVVAAVTVLVPLLNRTDAVAFPTITVGESPVPVEEQTTSQDFLDCGAFAAGESIEGEIAVGEKCAYTMTVPEPGLLILDARPAEGTTGDLTLQAFDADGEQRAGNDDRGTLIAVGGGPYDPILVLNAPIGAYQIAVGTFANLQSATFVLTTYYVDEFDLDHSDELTFGDDDFALTRALMVEEAGDVVLEASSDDGVFAMVVDTVTGELHLWESAGADPLVAEVDLQPGRHLLVISRTAQSAGDLTYSIGPA